MKPNWPLIGIISGAVVTLAIVVAIFVSTATTPKHAALPTTVALSSVSGASSKQTVSLSLTDTCAYTIIDGVTSFAIWPKGYTRDSTGNVLAPDGSSYADGDSFAATTIAKSTTAIIALDGGGDDGFLGTLLAKCGAGATRVTILTAIGD